MKHASPGLAELLRAIDRYEAFARLLEDAFNECLFEITSCNKRVKRVSTAELGSLPCVKRACKEVPKIFAAVEESLAPFNSTALDLKHAFGELAVRQSGQQWAQSLMDHHCRTQKGSRRMANCRGWNASTTTPSAAGQSILKTNRPAVMAAMFTFSGREPAVVIRQGPEDVAMSQQDDISGRAGYAKILDAWERPVKAGEPVGCAATSFTFSPDFFETECLGRFLGLESVPEDGSAYYVEREEKLAQLARAAALVDQHHVQGCRNLRWDLLSARVTRGILHAKISLLFWSQQVRLIIASANLTPDGCRRNHEVFGVLDFFPGSEAPLPVLWEVLDFLKDASSYATTPTAYAGPAIRRWLRFLDRVRKAARHWGTNQPRGRFAKTQIISVLSGPKRPSVLQSLKANWPEAAGPSRAYVISPFFDPPKVANKPARNLWRLLTARSNKSA